MSDLNQYQDVSVLALEKEAILSALKAIDVIPPDDYDGLLSMHFLACTERKMLCDLLDDYRAKLAKQAWELAKLKAGDVAPDEPPPCDNDHVAPGCEQFKGGESASQAR